MLKAAVILIVIAGILVLAVLGMTAWAVGLNDAHEAEDYPDLSTDPDIVGDAALLDYPETPRPRLRLVKPEAEPRGA